MRRAATSSASTRPSRVGDRHLLGRQRLRAAPAAAPALLRPRSSAHASPISRLAARFAQQAQIGDDHRRGRSPCTCRRSSAPRRWPRSAPPSRPRCGPCRRQVAVISTAERSGTQSRSTATEVSASGWHSGISSAVRFAAMMPARRADREHVALGDIAGLDARQASRAASRRARRRPRRGRSPPCPRHRPCGRGPRGRYAYRSRQAQQPARRRRDIAGRASATRRPGSSAPRRRRAGRDPPDRRSRSRRRRCGPSGTSGASFSAVLQIDLQGLQIAVVDADQPAIEPQARGRARRGRAPRPARQGRARRRPRRARAPSPSSSAAMISRMQSAPIARLSSDLVRVEDEILAQHRQSARGARRAQIVVAALEIRRVGQHREAGRAARLVGARERTADRNRRGSGRGSGRPS